MSGRPSGIGRGIPPPSRMQMPKVGTSITKSRVGQVTTTASGTRIRDAVSTSSTTVTARGPAGRLAPPGSIQRPSSGLQRPNTGLTRPTSVTKITAAPAPGTSGRQTTKVSVSGANIRAPPAAAKPARPSSARPASVKSAAAKAKECGAACAGRDKSGKAKPREPPESQEMPEARHVEPGRYYMPVKTATGALEANSPLKLKQRLTKYTPTGLSHWKIELNDPFAKDLGTVRKAHPDIQSGFFQVPYGDPKPEEMEPYERIKYRDLMEQTLNPYLPEEQWSRSLKEAMALKEEEPEEESEEEPEEEPEEQWSMSLKEAMALKEGEYEDEGSDDEDDELQAFQILEAQMDSVVEAKLPETPTAQVRARSPQQSVREKSPYQQPSRSPRQQSPQQAALVAAQQDQIANVQAQQNIDQQIQHLADYVDRISDGQTLVPSPRIPGLTEEQQAQLEAEKVARYVRNIAMQFLEQEQIEGKRQALLDAQQTAAMQALRRQREQERAQAIALIKDTEEFIEQEKREANQQAQIQAAQVESWKRAKAQRDAQERQRAREQIAATQTFVQQEQLEGRRQAQIQAAQVENWRRAQAQRQMAATQQFVEQEQREGRRQAEMQAAQIQNWKRAQAQRQAERARAREHMAATQQFVEQEQREGRRQAEMQAAQIENWKRAQAQRQAERTRALAEMAETQQFLDYEQSEGRRQAQMQAAQVAGWQQARAPRAYTDGQEQARAAQIAAQERARARDEIVATQRFVEYEQRYISAQMEAWQQHRDAQDRAQQEAQRRTQQEAQRRAQQEAQRRALARAQMAATQQFVEQEQREGRRQAQIQAAQIENWQRAQAQRQAREQMAATQQFVEQEQREGRRQAQIQAAQIENWKRAQAQRQAREQMAATQQFVEQEQREGRRQAQMQQAQMGNWKRAQAQRQAERARAREEMAQTQQFVEYEQRQGRRQAQWDAQQQEFEAQRQAQILAQSAAQYAAQQRQSRMPKKTESECMPCGGLPPKRSPSPSDEAMERVSVSQRRSPVPSPRRSPVPSPRRSPVPSPRRSPAPSPTAAARSSRGTADVIPVIPSIVITPPSDTDLVGDQEPGSTKQPDTQEQQMSYLDVPKKRSRIGKPSTRLKMPSKVKIRGEEDTRTEKPTELAEVESAQEVGVVEAPVTAVSKLPARRQLRPPSKLIKFPETKRMVETRQVTPSVIETPIGPVEAKQETLVERTTQMSRKGAVVDTHVVGTRKTSPGVAEQTEVVQRDVVPPTEFAKHSTSRLKFVPRKRQIPLPSTITTRTQALSPRPPLVSAPPRRSPSPPAYISPRQPTPPAYISPRQPTPPAYISPTRQPTPPAPNEIDFDLLAQGYVAPDYMSILDDETPPMYDSPLVSSPDTTLQAVYGSPGSKYVSPRAQQKVVERVVIKTTPNEQSYTKLRYAEIHEEEEEFKLPSPMYIPPRFTASALGPVERGSPTAMNYVSAEIPQVGYGSVRKAAYKSPTQAPYISPQQAAYISPTQAQYISPTQALYISPTQAPYISPTQAPYISPTQAPYISPTQAPYISPTQAPYISPTQAPYISPTQAPYISPAQAAYISPTQAPYISPAQAPYISPTQAPYISPTQPAYISPTQPAYISPAPVESMTQAYMPPAQTYIAPPKQSRRSPSPPPQPSAKRLTQSSSVPGMSPSAQEVTPSLPKKNAPRLCMPCSARVPSPITESTPSLPSLIPLSASSSLTPPLNLPTKKPPRLCMPCSARVPSPDTESTPSLPSLIPPSAPPSVTPPLNLPTKKPPRLCMPCSARVPSPDTEPTPSQLSLPSLIPPSAPPSLTPSLTLPTKKPPKLCMPCCSTRPSPPKKTPRKCMPCGSRKPSPPPSPPPKSKRTPSPTKSAKTPSTPTTSLTARPPPTSPTIPLDVSVQIPEDLDQTSLNDIEALVAEEKADVMVSKMVSSPLKEKLQRMKKKKPKCMRLLEETLDENIPMPNHGDTMTSDIMAAMMEGEEKGIIATTKSPKKTYETLFPPLEDEPTVEISSVSPAPLQDIMVPLGEANTEDIAIVTEEIEQIASTAEEIPTADLYAETVAKIQEDVAEEPKQGEEDKDEKEDKEQGEDKKKDDKKETERKKKEDKKKVKEKESEKKKKGKGKKKDDVYIPGETLEGIKAPWELDISSLENLVGGKLFTSVEDILISDDSIRRTDDKIEYVLECTKTKFFSCYQSRGSQWPSWFRGYCSVFPHNPNYVKLEKSPSRIMASAWKIFAPPTILNDSAVSFF